MYSTHCVCVKFCARVVLCVCVPATVLCGGFQGPERGVVWCVCVKLYARVVLCICVPSTVLCGGFQGPERGTPPPGQGRFPGVGISEQPAQRWR